MNAEVQETGEFLNFQNHQQTLTGPKMFGFFKSKAFVNVTLVCNGENIEAHQEILCAWSPYFENILLGKSLPNPIIILPGIEKRNMLLVLEYIYKGHVAVPKACAASLLETARMLLIKGLGEGELKNGNLDLTE